MRIICSKFNRKYLIEKFMVWFEYWIKIVIQITKSKMKLFITRYMVHLKMQ